jgi:hypothetical protein
MSTSGSRRRAISQSATPNKGGAFFNLLRDDLGKRINAIGSQQPP